MNGGEDAFRATMVRRPKVVVDVEKEESGMNSGARDGEEEAVD